MAFEDLGENMGKKMGPFPVWVWGVLIGGAFVVWYWVSQRDAGQSALADSVEDSETGTVPTPSGDFGRSEEHTHELQSLMRITYSVLCLKKKKYYMIYNKQ